MSRYTILLLGLLAVMVTVYGDDEDVCCGDNETWNICGTLCEPTCKDPKPDPRQCPRRPCTISTAACRCDDADGYVRDTDGSCVLPADCENNEDYQ